MDLIFPWLTPNEPRYEVRLRGQLQELYSEWRRDKDATEPKFKIDNVHFAHDVTWRDNVLSIQSMHDGKFWAWKIGKVVCALLPAAPYIVNMI